MAALEGPHRRLGAGAEHAIGRLQAQRGHGLVPDGITGPKSWGLLPAG